MVMDTEEPKGAIVHRALSAGNVPKLPFEKSVYERNRILFLVQSALLGISYAIVWPTLWMYVETEFKDVDSISRKFLYGTTFVAYPISSMIAAHLVQKSTTFNTRMLFMTLNVAEIIGNLIYSLHFHPVCLFIGRFVAGIGDAFYVVIMQDVRITQSYKSGSVAAECLAAFIVGLIAAQILNVITNFIPFQIGEWIINSHNYPGLTSSILFCLMGLALKIFLEISDEDNETYRHPTNNNIPKATFDRGVLRDWGWRTIFICVFSFVHTYIVSLLEILIPIFIAEELRASPLSSILLYGFIALLYAMVLMFTMALETPMMLEFSLLISCLMKMGALMAAICLAIAKLTLLNSMLCLIAMIVGMTFMWSNEDVMYTNLIISLIPIWAREYSHDLRRTTSKFAFVLSGVTVPFMHSSAMLAVGLTLIAMVGLLFGMFILTNMFAGGKSKTTE